MELWVENLRRFLDRQEAGEEQYRATIASRLRPATEELVRQFPAVTHVAVIGSFCKPSLFQRDSDVDIVVRGLSAAEYFTALFLFERILQVPVDLVREEEIPESLRAHLTDALVLYAR